MYRSVISELMDISDAIYKVSKQIKDCDDSVLHDRTLCALSNRLNRAIADVAQLGMDCGIEELVDAPTQSHDRYVDAATQRGDYDHDDVN